MENEEVTLRNLEIMPGFPGTISKAFSTVMGRIACLEQEVDELKKLLVEQAEQSASSLRSRLFEDDDD